MRNRNARGGQWTAQQIASVWAKGQVVAGTDPNIKRKDACGAWIVFDNYGKTDVSTGWEIDHIKPVVKNGDDTIGNLQPLQWENNRGKGDNWPNWTCTTVARN